MGIELNTQQIYALYDLETWWGKQNDQLFEISGAAGTGKTTLIRYFIDRIGLDLSDVAFVAYMGKAATVMARNSLPGQTIHSLIYEYTRVLDLDEDGNIQLNERGKPKTKMTFELREKISKKVKLIVLDEAGMVNEKIGTDLLSYGIPIITLGDLNQLPPVFGKPFFLKNPNVILTQVMRQAEGDPIVWLAHRVLENLPLQTGVYGKSSVIKKDDLNEYILKKSDIVITGTNKLRYEVNNLFREQITPVRRLDFLNVGEKVVCRKNNWNRNIDDTIFLTNGLSGYVDFVDRESFNSKGLKIDFRPDFLKTKCFKNVVVDYKHLFESPSVSDDDDRYILGREKFEFAYALTCHSTQGSTYPNVVFLNEKGIFDSDTYRRLQYTAITRASEQVTVVL